MKNKFLLFAATMLACFACSDDDATQYVVAPELEAYVNTFISEAQERGVTIPQNNLIARLTTFEAQSLVNTTKKGDQNYLFVSEATFYNSAHPSKFMEYLIFTELGGLFLHKSGKAMDLLTVESTYNREAYFNELMQ